MGGGARRWHAHCCRVFHYSAVMHNFSGTTLVPPLYKLRKSPKLIRSLRLP